MGTIVHSNAFKAAVANGDVDFVGHSIKGALMATAFVFNKDTHDDWADVSASELAAGSGYTAGGIILAGGAVAEDDANDRANITFNDLVWTASGGSIGPASGVIFYDDTHATKVIIGWDPFASDLTATDTNTLTVSRIEFRFT